MASSRQIYGAVFHEVVGLPVVTWPENTKDAGQWFHSRLNLLDLYTKNKLAVGSSRYNMPPAFDDGCGEFLVLAAQLVRANIVGLIFTHVSDRKLGYEYIFEQKHVGRTASHIFASAHCDAAGDWGRVTIHVPDSAQVTVNIPKAPKDKTNPAPKPLLDKDNESNH